EPPSGSPPATIPPLPGPVVIVNGHAVSIQYIYSIVVQSRQAEEEALSQQLECLAYEFWQKRGSPVGSPQVDWARAQGELLRRQVERLAYGFWQERGSPLFGTTELDWYRAEEEVLHREIELLAFEYWQQRGSPFGTPAVDWFSAQSE